MCCAPEIDILDNIYFYFIPGESEDILDDKFQDLSMEDTSWDFL